MEYIGYVIVGVVVFWLGWHARGIVILANLSHDPDKMIGILTQIKQINLEDDLDSDDTELRVERVNNMLYAYTNAGQFIAQGPSLTELLESAHKRFPDKKFFGKIASDNTAKELAQ
jgi:hypothetical protein